MHRGKWVGLGLICSIIAWNAAAQDLRTAIEADWRLQEKLMYKPAAALVTPEEDAAGGCDGVIDGKWGFHTGMALDPFWQVDLGEELPVGRVVLWNRCDGSAGRNNHIKVHFSLDGQRWRALYTHNGKPFFGHSDNDPLVVDTGGALARYVRVQVMGNNYLHLDEIEVFCAQSPETNIALNKPATQVSTSEWSTSNTPPPETDWALRLSAILEQCQVLDRELLREGVDRAEDRTALAEVAARRTDTMKDIAALRLYLDARWIQRRMLLSHPLLDFDSILFTKRVPGSFNHMSDQYYGWFSRPGGGLYILRDFREDNPRLECLTTAFTEPGSFLRPMLSYDGTKVLFAWCRYYEGLADEPNKLDKNNVPEDAFFHVYEMNIDGSNLRRLTHGKYDDFDARYLPDGRIVFLSTRRGQSTQCIDALSPTLLQEDMPDSYVRCGGGPERPVAVYTLHTMNPDGGNLRPISPFEMFEWTPSVARDGRLLYSRWDYVDRWNMPFMSLWSMLPDGTNARIVYGNFTHSPHCTFEPMSIPGSNKIVFTASGHHAQTMGSLVLLDPSVAMEGTDPIRRLTPEIVFPEIEGWPDTYFANPWPLSEDLYLVAWGPEPSPGQGRNRSKNGMGLYLFHAAGILELIYRDPEITSANPIPLRPWEKPPVLANTRHAETKANEGAFLLADVYQGLKNVEAGEVKALRVVAVPPKTHPTMDYPNLGITKDDPGKCVLGTVPVEEDGSAYFHVPSGVIVFFQALDEQGKAIQTMRTATHVQPGQTLSCIGCHEPRQLAPPVNPPLASRRMPSPLTPGPEGSWPLRFDRLIQPVLDKHCVSCHDPEHGQPEPARPDLTAKASYESLIKAGAPSLHDTVWKNYLQSYSEENLGLAKSSSLMAMLTAPEGHNGVQLSSEELERFITWIDTYAQRLGAFSDEQERDLIALRERCAPFLAPRPKSEAYAVLSEESALRVSQSVE